MTFDDAAAQAGFPPPSPKVSPAAGVIDMHIHSHPDVLGRNLDDVDVAQIAKARGMRGIVLKNHVSETASRAALVMKVVPGIEVFGGIVLNKAVGGIRTKISSQRICHNTIPANRLCLQTKQCSTLLTNENLHRKLGRAFQ